MAKKTQNPVDLYAYDREKRLSYPLLCGVDEAGRGPLAGDVYAAAVILSPEHLPEGLNDSKKLTEKTRAAVSADSRNGSCLLYCDSQCGRNCRI